MKNIQFIKDSLALPKKERERRKQETRKWVKKSTIFDVDKHGTLIVASQYTPKKLKRCTKCGGSGLCDG